MPSRIYAVVMKKAPVRALGAQKQLGVWLAFGAFMFCVFRGAFPEVGLRKVENKG